MVITTIKRSYSKTINTRNYGDQKENWIKLEMEAEAIVERNENEFDVSSHLFLFVKNEIIKECQKIIECIQKPFTTSPSSLTAKEHEAQINPPKL